jgi:hypothetical protein
MDDNVVEFPRTGKKIPNKEAIIAAINASEETQLDELVHALTYIVSKTMENMGLEDVETDIDDFWFMQESIKSLIYGMFEREHPLQKVAMMTIESYDDETYRFIPPEFVQSDSVDETDADSSGPEPNSD